MALLSSIESEEWYCGKISRRTAEEYLMGHINARGTFLIRYFMKVVQQYILTNSFQPTFETKLCFEFYPCLPPGRVNRTLADLLFQSKIGNRWQI